MNAPFTSVNTGHIIIITFAARRAAIPEAKEAQQNMANTQYLRGLRDGLPIGLGYFAVSFGLGISCRAAGLSAAQSFFLSLLNNASAGEYGGITVIAADSGFLVVALMMLVVNARYLLMSCALSQRLAPDTPLRWRMLIAFDLTDELFAIAIARPGDLEVWYYFGAMCAAMPCWSIGTALGVLAGSIMPEWAVSGCSVMLYGMFIAIIVPVGKQNRVVLGCIAVSFLCSYLASVLPLTRGLSEGLRILILTVVIAAAAAVLFPHKEDDLVA